jgi:hypothetical protein
MQTFHPERAPQVIFAFSSLNVRVNTTTQGSENQCRNGGQSFDDQQEAYTLAQAAEQYRGTNPSPANYGLGSYTLCDRDSSGQRQGCFLKVICASVAQASSATTIRRV